MFYYKCNIVKLDRLIVFQPLESNIDKLFSLRFLKNIGDKYDFTVGYGPASLDDTGIYLGLDKLRTNELSAALRTFNDNESRDEYYEMLHYLISETTKYLNLHRESLIDYI